MTKYFADTRPGYFEGQFYEYIKPLRPHINPPSSTAIVVKNRYGVFVWKEISNLAPATKQDFIKQRN